MKIDGPDISNYGVIAHSNINRVDVLNEKPNFEDAPSDLASIRRYVLTPDIFEILKRATLGANAEIQLADALNIMAARGGVDHVLLNGKRFDCGSKVEYVNAIICLAKKFDLINR